MKLSSSSYEPGKTGGREKKSISETKSLSVWIIEISRGGENELEIKSFKLYFCCSQMHPQHRLRCCSPSSHNFLQSLSRDKFNCKFPQKLFPSLLVIFLQFIFFSFSFLLSRRVHRHFDTLLKFPSKFNSSGAKLRLTNWRCSSSLVLTTRQNCSHRSSPREIRAKHESCATWDFFSCLHTPNLFSFFLYTRATRYWKKVPFTASPTMRMCAVLKLSFHLSVEWGFFRARWKREDMRRSGTTKQPGRTTTTFLSVCLSFR